MSACLPDKAKGTVSVVSFVLRVSCLRSNRCQRKRAIRDAAVLKLVRKYAVSVDAGPGAKRKRFL
jgi:hypothetical protein